MKKITLIQSRHVNAPEEGQGYVYPPNFVLMVTARIMQRNEGQFDR